MVKTCSCASPLPYQDGNKERCAGCWLIVQLPKEEQPSPPPSIHTPLVNSVMWIRHSHKMGMSAERISRDLGVSIGVVKMVLN